MGLNISIYKKSENNESVDTEKKYYVDCRGHIAVVKKIPAFHSSTGYKIMSENAKMIGYGFYVSEFIPKTGNTLVESVRTVDEGVCLNLGTIYDEKSLTHFGSIEPIRRSMSGYVGRSRSGGRFCLRRRWARHPTAITFLDEIASSAGCPLA